MQNPWYVAHTSALRPDTKGTEGSNLKSPSRLAGGRSGGRLQAPTAVGTELVAKVYAALAVWADRLQAVAAAGTEAEGRLDLGIALWTVGGARFAQNEIKHDSQPVGDKDGDERPKQAVHAAPPRVLVYVTDQHGVAAERSSREESQQASKRKPGCMGIPAHDGHKEHSDRHEDQGE